jgi:hypothetical protein
MISSNLEMIRGKAASWAFVVTDDDGVAQPIGALDSFWFTAKTLYSDADPGVFQLTRGSGVAVDGDGTAGTGTITTTPSSTSSLENRDHRLAWDLQHKPNGGNARVVARGTLFVYPAVTIATA